MQKKIVRRNFQISEELSHLPPLLQRIYSNRGIRSAVELENSLNHLVPFHSLLGIQQAVECLAEALYQQKKILIVGDFDADGATSTAVAIRSLKSFGAKNV